jgi:Mrp family chromosome partitioning ATPase
MNGGPIKKSARKLMAVLAGSRAPEPAELLGSERFRTFVDEVKQDYDVVVIDTSPVLAVVDALEVVSLADAVLLCVRAAKTTREQAAAAKAAIEHLPKRPAGIVVTGIRPRDEGYGYYSYSYSYSAEKS